MGSLIWSRDIICLHILLRRKKFLCSKICKQIMYLDQMRDPTLWCTVYIQSDSHINNFFWCIWIWNHHSTDSTCYQIGISLLRSLIKKLGMIKAKLFDVLIGRFGTRLIRFLESQALASLIGGWKYSFELIMVRRI